MNIKELKIFLYLEQVESVLLNRISVYPKNSKDKYTKGVWGWTLEIVPNNHIVTDYIRTQDINFSLTYDNRTEYTFMSLDTAIKRLNQLNVPSNLIRITY